jgi:hypothetical protein
MKITTILLFILVSINLVACVGGGEDSSDNTNNSSTGDSNSGNSNSGNSDTDDCTNSLTDTPQQSSYQRVYDNCIVWDEITDTGSVTIKYNSDTSESTGLGLRIHYDSASMTFVEASNVFSEDLIITPETQNDNEDFDQNNTTDKFINAAWAAFTGYWGIEFDQELATLVFQKIEGGSTNYNLSYTASSITPGITFNP